MTSIKPSADKIGILLVLQNRATLNLLTKILQPQPMSEFGMNILGAVSTSEARSALELFVPNIIVLDLDLEGSWLFLYQLRREFPGIDILAVTSSDQRAQLARVQGTEHVLLATSDTTFIESLLSLLGVEDGTAPKGPEILLIGENGEEVATLFALLMHSGYSVRMCETAATAVDMLERGPEVHLILMDMLVPGGGALDLIKEARLRFPRVGTIVLTSGQDGELARLAISLGAFECLAKPLDADRVIGAIEAYLAHIEYRSLRPWRRRIWENTA